MGHIGYVSPTSFAAMAAYHISEPAQANIVVVNSDDVDVKERCIEFIKKHDIIREYQKREIEALAPVEYYERPRRKHNKGLKLGSYNSKGKSKK